MSPIEKLARRICWLGFIPPRSVSTIGKTEAGYWRDLPAESRAGYMEDARQLCFLHNEFSEQSSGEILDAAAQSYHEGDLS